MTRKKTPQVNSRWVYYPTPFDRIFAPYAPEPGTIVKVVQPPSCPKNGTMDSVYIADAETSDLIGLVQIDSLKKVSA